MDDPAKPQQELRRGGFKPGHDPRRFGGRKPGSKNKVLVALDKVGGDAAKAVLEAAVGAALTGDVQAQALILSRVWPVPKGRTVSFDAPPIATAADVANAMQAVLDALAAGALTPEEGTQIAGLLETRRKTIETEELAALLKGFEQQRR